jgi:hypothetical protein
MKAKIAAIMVILLVTLCHFQVALASDLFYVGDIIIDSIGIRVEAGDEATFKAIYLLRNRGGREEEINLQFAQSPVPLQANGEKIDNPVVFKPGERKSINLTCKLDITGKTTKVLSLDPTLLFNGKPNSEPTKVLLIKVLLPEGITGLACVNQEPDEEGFEGGRKFYSWSSIDIYPTTLCLKWSTLKVDLGVEKGASPQEINAPDQIINLEITVQNKGDTAVNNITLTDQYVAFDFEAVEPLEEFGKRETMLFWVKKIDSLGPGETRTLVYSVKYIGFSPRSHDFDLKPCVVTVDGHLVSVSNKVRMSQSGKAMPPPAGPEAPMEPEAAPVHYPSLPVIGGIILILAILGGAGYFIRRRGRAKQKSSN